MPRRTPRLLATAVAAVVLAAPGAAAAQSAGDDQYADPFGQVPDEQPKRDTGSSEPAPPRETNGSPGQVAGSGQAAGTSVRPQQPADPGAAALPRTGVEMWTLAAMGLVVFGTGAALRRLVARRGA